MDDAWMRERDGRFTPVTAAQVQNRYRGHVPGAVRFICPMCRQPLTPAAMSYGSIQSPHFRHQVNNPTAQRCERFARGNGGYASALYQRMPLPMFIGRDAPSSNAFVVSGGFRSLSQTTLEVLSASGARLVVGTREYVIDERRFGKGVTRIPFNELGLNPKRYVSLKNSPLPIESVWGLPEDFRSVMVFTRDLYTGLGKRVRRGEEVAYGEPVYLLGPRLSTEFAASRIPGCMPVGHVRCRMGGSTLRVLAGRIPGWSDMTREALAILEAEGIVVREDTSAPELVWPPSLRADGMVRTLPGYASATFATRAPAPGDERLYVYSGSSMLDDASSSRRFASQGSSCGYASVTLGQTVLLVTEAPGSFEQAVMVEACDEGLYSQVRDYDAGFEVSDEEATLRVRLTRPLEITCLRPGLPPSRSSRLGEWVDCDVGRTGVASVDKRLGARRGTACLWRRSPAPDGHDAAPEDALSDARLSLSRGRDATLATERKLGGARAGSRGRDRSLAAARRNSL